MKREGWMYRATAATLLMLIAGAVIVWGAVHWLDRLWPHLSALLPTPLRQIGLAIAVQLLITAGGYVFGLVMVGFFAVFRALRIPEEALSSADATLGPPDYPFRVHPASLEDLARSEWEYREGETPPPILFGEVARVERPPRRPTWSDPVLPDDGPEQDPAEDDPESWPHQDPDDRA